MSHLVAFLAEEGLLAKIDAHLHPKRVLIALTLVLTLAMAMLPSAPSSAAGSDLIRTAVARGSASVTVSSVAGFTVTNLATSKVVATAPPGSTWKFTPSATGVAVSSTAAQPWPAATSYTGPLVLAQPATATPTQYLALGSTVHYRGTLEIRKESGTALTVVNSLPLEQYLYGVIPREMPAGWAPEALKAQAIAARTYALYTKSSGKYQSLGYDLVATDESQVYGGVDGEDPRSNAAVDQTKSQVALYNGKIIAAYFHASSGGYTENS